MAEDKFIDNWKTFHPDAAHKRDEYLEKSLLIPELTILGWTHFTRAMLHAQEADTHDEEFEFHYLVGGELDWWVEDKRYTLRNGDLIMTRPGELHGAKNGVLQPSEFYWMRVKDSNKRGCLGLSFPEWSALRRKLLSESTHVFRAPEQIHVCFRKLIAEHRQPDSFSAWMCRALVCELLLWAARTKDNQPSLKIENRAPITFVTRKALRTVHLLLDKDITHSPLISELADQAGLSESAFRRRFEHDMGISPSAYISRRRIELAGNLLRSGKGVTDVAFKLGFSSSQHFSATFKKATGFTPTDYIIANDGH